VWRRFLGVTKISSSLFYWGARFDRNRSPVIEISLNNGVLLASRVTATRISAAIIAVTHTDCGHGFLSGNNGDQFARSERWLMACWRAFSIAVQ